MEFLSLIKNRIPDYAKDIRLNIDGTIARSSLSENEAVGAALAAAFAAKSAEMAKIFEGSGVLSAEEIQAAKTAAALMGMNNVWYPYVEMANDADLKSQAPQLRMNAYASHGGVDKRRFEMYALAASIIGKCHFCVQSHYALLRQEGMTAVQLRDVGRIAAVVNAASQVLSIEA